MDIIIEQTKERIVEVVFSPDENCHYINEWDMRAEKRRSSRQTWRTHQAAIKAFRAGKVRWEK